MNSAESSDEKMVQRPLATSAHVSIAHGVEGYFVKYKESWMEVEFWVYRFHAERGAKELPFKPEQR